MSVEGAEQTTYVVYDLTSQQKPLNPQLAVQA